MSNYLDQRDADASERYGAPRHETEHVDERSLYGDDGEEADANRYDRLPHYVPAESSTVADDGWSAATRGPAV